MVFKRLIGLLFVGALTFSAVAADIVVKIASPRIQVKKRPPAPSKDHVWISGYQRWDGNAYAWTPGR